MNSFVSMHYGGCVSDYFQLSSHLSSDLDMIVLVFTSSYQFPGGKYKLCTFLFLQRKFYKWPHADIKHSAVLACKSMFVLSIHVCNSATSNPKTFPVFLGILVSLCS